MHQGYRLFLTLSEAAHLGWLSMSHDWAAETNFEAGTNHLDWYEASAWRCAVEGAMMRGEGFLAGITDPQLREKLSRFYDSI